MVNITITDSVSKVGIVLKTQHYEDALSLIRTMHSYCAGFKKFDVSIKCTQEE